MCEAASEALDTTRSLSACGDCIGKECGCIAGASLDQVLADEDPQYSRMEWRPCNLTIPGKALMRMMLRVVRAVVAWAWLGNVADWDKGTRRSE